jgi:hypothetical protein
MDSIFQYNKYVIGKQFLGRGVEVRAFANLLSQGENIVIYEPPKTGRKSLVQQGLYTMKSSGAQFVAAQLSLLDIRTQSAFALRLAGSVLNTLGNNPAELCSAAKELLADTHFIFDENRFAASGEPLSLSGELNRADLMAAFLLPYRVGKSAGVKRIVVIDEFQNVMQTEDGDRLCQLLEEVFKTLPAELADGASYIFMGSQVNAMHEIFGVKRWFWRQAERLRIPAIETRDIIDHVVKGFLATGKVIDRDLLLGVCRLFRNNIWYINHFCAICDSLSRGYIMEQILKEALGSLVAIHEPSFVAIMNDLTTFQVNLLKAIIDGYTKFSTAEVIRKYSLNSSANVRRLKDALMKKEILTFVGDDERPVIFDPLFEYWLKNTYFKRN